MPRAKDDAKPKGCVTSYAFFVQTCREQHRINYPSENVGFTEFSKKCSEKWKTMSDQEKLKFKAFADADRQRYDREMKNYKPPIETKVRAIRRRQKKDPNAPKRNVSAFFWFCHEQRPKVKAMNPKYGVGDIAKELGRLWGEASLEVKTKCQTLATGDRARYERELTVYENEKEAALAHNGNDEDEYENDESD